MKTLHITNGSCTLDLMDAAGIKGDKFSWDDVLHEGPVPRCESLEALSAIRAKFIAEQGWASQEQASKKFAERDAKLRTYQQYDEIILWFEHDLYDQLQLIQILSWFKSRSIGNGQLKLINTGKHLGHHTPEAFVKLQSLKSEVSKEQLTIASEVWFAFTSENAEDINRILDTDLSVLPYLSDAMIRLAGEFPDSDTGIPQTERLILECINESDRAVGIGELFRAYCEKEEAEFLGDSIFFDRINRMAFSRPAIIQLNIEQPVSFPVNSKQRVSALVESKKLNDWYETAGLTNQIGGVKIDSSNPYRWNEHLKKIERV